MASVFAATIWEFTLPNAATWFYFSAFLAVALFFQFSRLFTLRNFDLLALYLFVPGFLWIQDARLADPREGGVSRYLGYSWLLAASLYWFARCFADYGPTRRPLLSPNLSVPGLIWFGCALFLALAAVTYGRSQDPWEAVGREPVAVTGVQNGAAAVMSQAQGNAGEAADSLSDARYWVQRTLAILCHAAVVAGLVLTGWNRFADLPTGLAAGTLYLLLPYTAYHIGQIHHVWPAALVLWAVYLYRWPAWAGALLGVAAGTTFFPLLLLPVWLHFYRPRGLGHFAVGFGLAWLVGASATVGLLSLAGQFPDGMWEALHLADWQPWRVPTAESIWTGASWAYRVPVFALYAGFLVTALFWPPVRNLGHLIALSAAVLIGIQFWFADRGGLYVLWYSPLLLLLALRPNLSDLQPVDPGPWPAAFGRVARWLGRDVPLPAALSGRLPRLR